MLICDFHIHTEYSADCNLKLERLVERCRKVGLNCVAITDHNETQGALQLKKYAPFKVIVGEEIRTSEGELIGLFLEEKIPPGLSPEETVERIREQDGLVVVPHPFDRFRSSAIRTSALHRIIDKVDIIETFNSRNNYRHDNRKAEQLAKQHCIPEIAGSDAHFSMEIGNVKLFLQDFADQRQFLECLKTSSQRKLRRSSLLVHGGTRLVKWQNRCTSV
ncbi:PHP domain-containing protein [Calderihabitans maritimus]|uniref:Putative metal-dependent phosphoesterase n=1 Tax=Calderihabitans maritimus TaxID=1246530 RepID=A0A1Z5HWT3_9FIRM|nr:PHP domain-containing protein [Calderihabitans maritimus]GAW93992.1 putative metal-dependent phosphoesterase [Calderihabitans maritimus]